MGVKGRKKRERDRLAKELEADQLAVAGRGGDGSDEGEEFEDDFSEEEQLPKMKRSELYAMHDMEVMDRLAEEHKNRRLTTTTPKKKKAAPEDLSSVLESTIRHDDAHVFVDEDERRKKKDITTGCSFGHFAVGIDSDVVSALAKEGFTNMTPIQQRSIPLALQGYDILGQARTGSGKTLAFCVPMLSACRNTLLSAPKAFVCLILGPTKELCVQIHSVLSGVGGHVGCKTVLATGGTNVTTERKNVSEANVVVGTPGRVLDHVRHAKKWIVSSLRFLVLDEADRMLADGFQRDLDSILEKLPAVRQTLLFSATNSKSVQELARLSLTRAVIVDTAGKQPSYVNPDTPGPEPMYLAVKAEKKKVAAVGGGEAAVADETGESIENIPSTLKQYCCIVPLADRLRALYTFLKKPAKRSKVMVFCSTVASTTFHCMMMGSVGFHDDALMLHGHMKHRQRVATFEEFCRRDFGVLFCTDVAARGLDIPNVNWIVQFDPPMDPTEYIHRIGRTARAGSAGSALIFLAPHEQGFVKYLAHYGLKMEGYQLPPLPNIQEKLEEVLQIDPIVHKSARNAFKAYFGAYQSHVLNTVFDASELDIGEASTGFALQEAPHVALPKRDAEIKKNAYIKGKLKSMNKKKHEAKKFFDHHKTRQQWSDDGSFMGARFVTSGL